MEGNLISSVYIRTDLLPKDYGNISLVNFLFFTMEKYFSMEIENLFNKRTHDLFG